jgi:DNA-binding MarR family transcriptional regulator
MQMEHEHREVLHRIYQANDAWRSDGHASRTFQLLYTGGTVVIDHPRWGRSWPVPSEHVVDDLEELGLLRVEPHDANKKNRTFTLTVKGHEQARALDEAATFPTAVGGRAPSPAETLRWLVRIDEEAPETLEDPALLLDRSVSDGLIDAGGREALAKRILALIEEGYATAKLVDVDQIGAEQTLLYAEDFAMTIKASESVRPETGSGTTVNVYGAVVNSQVAGGDITNNTTFISILERAESEIGALQGVDEEIKQQAKDVIKALLGRGAAASGQILTGAGGALAAAVISKLTGFPFG